MSLANTADIATIILVIHALVACIVPLVLFYFVARGAIVLNRKTKVAMPVVQDYARQMADGAAKVSEQIAAPVVKVETNVARWRAMWSRSIEPIRRKPPASGQDA